MRDAVEFDVAVFGGGIAGLWLLARLRALGFDAHLFEKTALGSGQTIASQGIIHSGVKYTFDGVNRPQTEALSSMPAIWTDCMAGRGEINLRGTEVLATHQLMFTTGGLVNRLAGAVATRALRSDVGTLAGDALPELFRARAFSGQVYQLEEPVLATGSVLTALLRQHTDCVHRVATLQLERDDGGIVRVQAGHAVLRPRLCLFTSGTGNEWFADELGLEKARVTQRRPLRMFLARGLPHRVYAHCLVPEPKPRVTITSHELNGETVWYLGGNIAEKAVGMDDASALRWARSEMSAILPWLDWSPVRWAIHDVDRAEPAAGKLLPPGPTLTVLGNAALAWPTKLALAPALTRQALRWIEQQGVAPSLRLTPLSFSKAEVAKYPWEEVREWMHP